MKFSFPRLNTRLLFAVPVGLLGSGMMLVGASPVQASDAPPVPAVRVAHMHLSRTTDQFRIVRPQATGIGGGAETTTTTTIQTATVAAPFLTRPYWGWHGVNSVFDHCLSNGYYTIDGKICEVDGTVALRSNGVDPYFNEGYAVTPGGTNYLYYDGHNGWDIALSMYTPVLAAAPGKITFAGWDSSGWGNTVLIDHGNGFSTRYAHLDSFAPGLATGQTVGRGQQLGLSGTTGNSTGPHLHFGVYRNDMTVFGGEMTAIDPWGWQAAGSDPWPYDEGDLWLTGNPHDPIPDAPGNVAATPGAASATITWSTPFDGGNPINSYTAVATPGGASVMVSGTANKAVLTNLVPGTAYTFAVTATGTLGSSAPSAPSNAVKPIPAAAGYWEWVGGIAGSDPAVASDAPGTLDTFVRGTDGQLWTNHWNGSQWTGWGGLGGILVGAPAVVSWGSNRLDVFVRGSDNQLWHKWWDGAAWRGWEGLGGILADGPSAASWGSGRLDVFVRGSDNGLYVKTYSGGWLGYLPLSGVLASAPAATSSGAGRLDVFVEGSDLQMWHRTYSGSWSPWQSLGGILSGAPGATSPAVGVEDVYVKGSNSAIYRQRGNGSSWSGYLDLGGQWASAPAVTSRAGSGTVDMILNGVDQALYHSNLGPG